MPDALRCFAVLQVAIFGLDEKGIAQKRFAHFVTLTLSVPMEFVEGSLVAPKTWHEQWPRVGPQAFAAKDWHF
jgi:hypothetical protein